MGEEIHKYSNGKVTVVWKPKLCWHSGNCVNGLRSVFNSRTHPWVNIWGASSEDIIAQVKKCPSGALSFIINDEEKDTEEK